MKRNHFFAHTEAFRNLTLARAMHSVAGAANAFESNPALIKLYRSWMRDHALAAVRWAKWEAAR